MIQKLNISQRSITHGASGNSTGSRSSGSDRTEKWTPFHDAERIPPLHGWSTRRRLLLGAAGAVILLTILYFGYGVRAQLQSLATANSDNIQWNMSQAEVEHLALLVAIKSAAAAKPEDGLDDVRKRFDVLYSRIATLEAGALYADLRAAPEAAANLSRIRGFLDRNVGFIDADDETLRASLPAITADAQEIRLAIRDLALQAIGHFSSQKDQSRADISRTLLSIAVLSTFLFVLLCLLVLALNRLNRINQQRAHQTELDSSRLSAIVGTSLDAIMVVSGDGHVIDFNGAAEEISGYRRDEVIGQDMAELIIPDHLRPAHDAGMARYQSDGSKKVVGKGRIRIEAKRRSGEVFPVELSIQTARGEDGEIFVSYIRDISSEVDAENELRMARDSAIAGETSKARLLAVMSHEMRTPLNGLLGTMELLSATHLTEQQAKYLNIMGKSGRMLLSHVNDVLDISRLESDNAELQNTVFDVNDVVRDVIKSLRASAAAHSNELCFDATGAEFLVVTDQNRLRRVLLNLVGNAIKFTRNGEIRVEVDTLDDAGHFEIRVIDNGIGIADTDIDTIFEDFTTLDSTYGRKSEGTGLGLGIVQRIIKVLGGDIGVESEPGEGSLFWIRLPVGLSHEVPPQAPQSSATHSEAKASERTTAVRPLDILLVEDNEINRTIACEFLAVDGHRVTQANDGLEGIALANGHRFDLILMDISMPEIDGIEAMQRIRNGDGPSKDTPVIALTAHALDDDLLRFKQAGMRDVISKPVSGATLREAVIRLASQDKPGHVTRASEDLIDLEAIDELRQQIGPRKFRDIVHKFCTHMDEETPRIMTADLSGEDRDRLARTAHKLSGSAGVLGASHLNLSLQRLEQTARAGETERHLAQVQDVKIVWQRTRTLLLDEI